MPGMKLVLVDDWPSIREIWRDQCEQDLECKCEIVGETGDGEEAVECICRTKPDCVLLDLELLGMSGFEVISAVREQLPWMRFILVSAHCTRWSVYLAKKFHVVGFVDKRPNHLSDIKEAIHQVNAGGFYYSKSYQSITIQLQYEPCRIAQVLSDREQELLLLLIEPHSIEDIASRTGLSPGTVKNHRNHILQKLCMPNRLQLIRYAHDMGFARLRLPKAEATIELIPTATGEGDFN